jgi:hypothetical protein
LKIELTDCTKELISSFSFSGVGIIRIEDVLNLLVADDEIFTSPSDECTLVSGASLNDALWLSLLVLRFIGYCVEGEIL